MEQARSPFDVLGVTPLDDFASIRAAWRKKVRDLHPDTAQDPVSDTAELAEANAAFDQQRDHEPAQSAEEKPVAEMLPTIVTPSTRPPATVACPQNVSQETGVLGVHWNAANQAAWRRAAEGYAAARSAIAA